MQDNAQIRCNWAQTDDKLMRNYHDKIWGKPCHNNQMLFELLSLEIMQAGLSWKTILHRQKGFEKAFANFNYQKVANMDNEVPKLLQDKSIIRNRRKILAIINNAKIINNLNANGTTFNEFIWKFVDNQPLNNNVKTSNDVPVTTALATKISKKLKQFGFKFTGPVVVYSFMQASGMVNDHLNNCIAK